MALLFVSRREPYALHLTPTCCCCFSKYQENEVLLSITKSKASEKAVQINNFLISTIYSHIMKQDEIYHYNSFKKKIRGIFTIAILSVIAYSFVFFSIKTGNLIGAEYFGNIINFVTSEYKSFTLRGIFLVGVVGGLFFVPTPLEALYMDYVSRDVNIVLVYFLFLIGITISYSINFFIGYWFSNASKKLISTKKFYQIKRWLNRFGKYAVFIANAIPFAPSQQVALIMGVFKYNRYKFYAQFFLGQGLKLLILIGIVSFFK